MPYRVARRGALFFVINTRTGIVRGRHASKAKAEKQRRALEVARRRQERG